MSSPTQRASALSAARPRGASCCGNARCHHQAHQQLQQFRYELYLEMRLAMQQQQHEQAAGQRSGSKHDHRVARSLLSELEETETEDDGSSGEDVREQKPRAGSDSEGSVTSDGSNADAAQHLHVPDGLTKVASASSSSSSSAASVASTLSPLSALSASGRSESCCASSLSSSCSSASPAEPSTIASRPSAAVEVLLAAEDDALSHCSAPVSPSPSFPFSSPVSPAAFSSPSPTAGRSTPHFSLLSSPPALPLYVPEPEVQSPLLVLSEQQTLRLQAAVCAKPPQRLDVSAAPIPVLLSLPNNQAGALSPRSLTVPPSPSTPSSPSSTSPSAHKTIIVRSTYLLTAVDRVPVAAGACFLSLNLSPSDTAPRGLQLVQAEAVTRHIDMQRIVSCSTATDDGHVLSLLYQRVLPASVSDSSSPSAEEKESLVQETAEFRLSSLLDAQHVRALMAALVSVSPASSAIGRVVPSVKGQQCVRKGWIEHQTGSSSSGSDDGGEAQPVWTRRFARLYDNRLLFFRTAYSPLPVHVVPLSCDGPESRAAVSSPGALQVRLDCCNGDSGSRTVVWRCQDDQTHQDWLQALQAEAPTPQPPATPPAPATPVRKTSISERSESHSSTSPSSASLSSSSLPLSSLIASQRSFMAYLLEVSALRPLCPSSLPSAAAFQLLTPSARLRRRQAALCSLDSALLSYHHLLAALFSIWCEARLLMVDRLEQSGSGQIGFSFPGFDTQVFDVGKLCVIACGQLLSPQPHALLFTARDFQLAMESSSPAKEMMQSSPDITQLFARGEREEARALAAQSQRLLLHHCALASHVKSHQTELRAGDVLVWEEVMATVGSRSSNTAVLDMYRPVSYVFNPSLTALHSLIAQVKCRRKTETAAVYASFPAAISYATAAAVALPVKPSPTHTRSASASTSASTSPVQPSSPAAASTSRGFFSRVLSSPSKSTPPVSPSSSRASKSTPPSPRLAVCPPPASPLSPIALVSPVVSSLPAPLSPASCTSPPVADLRCLADPLHLLLLLRTLLHYRRHALSSLLAAVTDALQSMKAAPSPPSDLAAVQSLHAEAEKEKEAVMAALSALPRQEEIELEDRRERRERRERKEEQDARRFMRGKSGTITGPGPAAAAEEKEDREGADIVSVGSRHPDELARAIVVLTLQERETSGG